MLLGTRQPAAYVFATDATRRADLSVDGRMVDPVLVPATMLVGLVWWVWWLCQMFLRFWPIVIRRRRLVARTACNWT